MEHSVQIFLQNDAQNGVFEPQEVRRIDFVSILFIVEIKGGVDGMEWIADVLLNVDKEGRGRRGGDGALFGFGQIRKQRLDDLAAVSVVFDHFGVIRRDESEQNELELVDGE